VLQRHNRLIAVYEGETLEEPTGWLSFRNIPMRYGESMQDQIEVIRVFDYVEALGAGVSPTQDQINSMFSLRNTDSSGSSMYTISEGAYSIQMSDDLDDYMWLGNGIHHDLPLDIQLPIASSDDTIIIKHKDYIATSIIQWEPSDFIIAAGLNTGIIQILWTFLDIEVSVFYPHISTFYIGFNNGLARLGEDTILNVSSFPSGIGPTGEPLDGDLEGSRLYDVGDVYRTVPFPGFQVEWRSALNKWIPSVPFGYTGIVNKPAGTILRWKLYSGGWVTEQILLNEIDDVYTKEEHDGDGIPHGPQPGALINRDNANTWTLGGNVKDKPPDTSWSPDEGWIAPYGSSTTSNDPNNIGHGYHISWNSVRNQWEYNKTLQDEYDYYTFEWNEEHFAIGDLGDVELDLSVPKRAGQLLTWDTSAGTFTNRSYNMESLANVQDPPETIPDGYVLIWDTSLYHPKQDPADPPEGMFKWGAPMSMIDTVDTSVATDNDILKLVSNEGTVEWRVGPHYLGDLGKVSIAGTPKNGTDLVWSGAEWKPRYNVGDPDDPTSVYYLNTELSYFIVSPSPGWPVSNREVIMDNRYGLCEVLRDGTITGFSMFQPLEIGGTYQITGPGAFGGTLYNSAEFDDYIGWKPAGFLLYRDAITYDGDDEDGIISTSALLDPVDKFDGLADRYIDGTYSGYNMLDEMQREHYSFAPEMDGQFYKMSVSVNKGDILRVEYLISPEDNTQRTTYQKAFCTWRLT